MLPLWKLRTKNWTAPSKLLIVLYMHVQVFTPRLMRIDISQYTSGPQDVQRAESLSVN